MFPIYETDRLIIDRITNDDSSSIYKIFSNHEVVKYYNFSAFTEMKQSNDLIKLINDRIEKSLGIRWAIRLKDSGKLIGTCGYNSWNMAMHTTVIGYDLKRECWGFGYMLEALNMIVISAFNGDLECATINRIQADTIPGNFSSENLLLKLGFKEEGVLRQNGYWDDKYHDLKCFSLLKDEFDKVSK